MAPFTTFETVVINRLDKIDLKLDDHLERLTAVETKLDERTERAKKETRKATGWGAGVAGLVVGVVELVKVLYK